MFTGKVPFYSLVKPAIPVNVLWTFTKNAQFYCPVKTSESSKESIRYESQLVEIFQRQAREDLQLTWQIPSEIAIPAKGKTTEVELVLDEVRQKFQTFFRLQLSIGEIVEKLKSSPRGTRLLLVTPQLSDRILDFCRQQQISAIDLNGRAYLRAPGLHVEREAVKGRNYRFELEPRNIFVGKSCQIVRTLLTDRDRSWSQAELVHRTHASSGLVSRIVGHLLLHGFVAKINSRELRLVDPIGLVNAWAKADDFHRRATTSRYSTFAAPGVDLAEAIYKAVKSDELQIAFTQWIAGWLRFPYTEPPLVSAYVSKLPSEDALKSLSLRPVSDAGVVWLHVPHDEGVFLELQNVENLPLVSDAQIVVDLTNTGLRGPDQATALLNWEGFARPS